MSVYIHADLDAFFASVEQIDHSEYRGKPVIVGGLPGDKRSVVSTASYEARKYGVHSAMPIAQAYRICPQGIFLRGNMKRYKEKSNEVMSVFNEFSPCVQQMSIDEAFLDVSGTEKLFGKPEDLAKNLKNKIFEKTELTVSLGIASNKYVAKIASGLSKPSGTVIVEKGGEEKFMLSLNINKIWGAGKKTQEQFRKYNITTMQQLYELPLEILITMFGNAFGEFLHNAVRGKVTTLFNTEPATHSISAERTFGEDLCDNFFIENALLDICYKLMFRITEHKMQSKTVFIKIRYSDFFTETAQVTHSVNITSVNELFESLKKLFYAKYKTGKKIRLLGAGFMNIKQTYQSDLFDSKDPKKETLEKCIHEINKKFPNNPIKKARLF
ncbi:MAG: DNA polymerase IV [Spirochaetaceae bacterium]|jgi:DNA polymerase-4|nr:DNA polymerase IV [Spirochaetaceae bacterium]